MKHTKKIIITAALMAGISTGSYYTYNEFGELKEDNKKLSEQVSNLSDLVVNNDKLINNYKTDIEALKGDNQKLNDRVSTLAEDTKEIDQSVQEVESSVHGLKQQLEKATKRNESPIQVSRGTNSKVIKSMNMELTFYSNHPSENGLYNGRVLTKTGYDITNTIKYHGYGIVASHNSELPLYSLIEIEGLGKFYVLDSGNAIGNGKLDVLVSSKEEAFKRGRYTAKVNVLKIGKGE